MKVLLRVLLGVLLTLDFVGCGAGGNAISGTGPLPAPQITAQPADQSVPMGLTGIFSVQAVGLGLHFQWSRNNSAIAGATSSSYTTQATAFSDTGAQFSVTVTNATGSATSQPATLTITARAPIPGDLRFQQVDSDSSRNGYTISPGFTALACSVAGQGGIAESFAASFGTGFALTNQPCLYSFTAFHQPASLPGLEMAYSVGPFQDFPSVLNQSISLGGPTPNDPGSVISSLALSPSGAAFAFVHSDTVSGFTRFQFIVPAASLQALAYQEGLRGCVITAVSFDGSEATVLSYGWSGDPTSLYDTKVIFTTLSLASGAITQLASEGYILTASAGTQVPNGSGVILLGSRVLGDVMPRPVLVGDVLSGTVDPLLQQGYAIVARVTMYDPQTSALTIQQFIGER